MDTHHFRYAKEIYFPQKLPWTTDVRKNKTVDLLVNKFPNLRNLKVRCLFYETAAGSYPNRDSFDNILNRYLDIRIFDP
jgi:hypothetical protein